MLTVERVPRLPGLSTSPERDRKNVFLEIGFGDHAFAEVIEENGKKEIILYADPDLGPLDFRAFVDFITDALTVDLVPDASSR